MNKNIENYIFHKENFLDEKYCENSIDELNECEWQKHEEYYSEQDEPEAIQQWDFSFEVGMINENIIQNLHPAILEYIENLKFDWFNGWTAYSVLKFIRYCPGQTMENHCDHIQSLFDGERKGIPILSLIGILNDDYEGGELIMCGDKKIDTKKGDLIIFPSNFLYPHEITPVTKGVRYSYVSWVW